MIAKACDLQSSQLFNPCNYFPFYGNYLTLAIISPFTVLQKSFVRTYDAVNDGKNESMEHFLQKKFCQDLQCWKWRQKWKHGIHTTHNVKGGAEVSTSLEQWHASQDIQSKPSTRHGYHKPPDVTQVTYMLAPDEWEDDVVILLALVAINGGHLTRK